MRQMDDSPFSLVDHARIFESDDERPRKDAKAAASEYRTYSRHWSRKDCSQRGAAVTNAKRAALAQA